jgi:hypothetical protein
MLHKLRIALAATLVALAAVSASAAAPDAAVSSEDVQGGGRASVVWEGP